MRTPVTGNKQSIPGQFQFAGIDVGGPSKGFHLVGLTDGNDISCHRAFEPSQALTKLREWRALSVAIDAPITWAKEGKSRSCERALEAAGIHCFKTPTEYLAGSKSFYGWVRHGLLLYQTLAAAGFRYVDAGAEPGVGMTMMETFPHAVALRLNGVKPAGQSKVKFRRLVLRDQNIQECRLSNLDFVDAALCALVSKHAFKAGIDELERPGGKTSGMVIPKPAFGGKNECP